LVNTTIEKIPKNALTASVEGSFSTLGRLKTYIRNQFGNVRLTGVALMTIHRNIPLQIDDIVNNFIEKNRKMFFPYLFYFVFFFYYCT